MITIYVSISIVLAEAANQPKPSIPDPTHFRSIRVLELPGSGEPVWTLSVSECIMRQEARWEARLSTDEFQHLKALLEQIPSRSMSLKDSSYDGTVYEVKIIRAKHRSPLKNSKVGRFLAQMGIFETTHSFRWRNDDWQHASGSAKGVWARVAAIADHMIQVVDRTRPASG